MNTVYYSDEFLMVLALNLGVPAVANKIWLKRNFPTLWRYL